MSYLVPILQSRRVSRSTSLALVAAFLAVCFLVTGCGAPAPKTQPVAAPTAPAAEAAPALTQALPKAPAPVAAPAPKKKPAAKTAVAPTREQLEAAAAEIAKSKAEAAAQAEAAAAEKAQAEAEAAAQAEAAVAEIAKARAEAAAQAETAAAEKALADEAARIQAEAVAKAQAELEAAAKIQAELAARAQAEAAAKAVAEAAAKAAADKAAADRAAAEKAAVEKAAAEKAAFEKAAAERLAAEKALAKAAADMAAADKAAEDQAAAEKLAAEKAAAKGAADKAAADKALAEKKAADKALADKLSAEKAAAEKAIADKAAADAAADAAVKAEVLRIANLDVPPPTFKTAGGVFAVSVQVAIDPPDLKEAQVNYTIDGSEPSAASGQRYTVPFSISKTTIVKARAFVVGGKVSPVVASEYDIGEICAAPGGKGDGRRGAPLGNVAAAISLADTLGIHTIKLATGAFTESFSIKSGGLSIKGGYKADFSADGAARTRISGIAGSASTKKAPAAAMVISGSDADATLHIEHIEFHGGEASYSSGILIADKASPELLDCTSYGGSGSYGYGAVVAGSANPTFRLCRLDGAGGATSYGLAVDGATVSVVSSYLVAGTGTVGGCGLQATDAKAFVASSVLAGNAANLSYGAAYYNSKGSRLENCTISGGTGSAVVAIFISASDPDIENCIIAAYGSAKSFGVQANYGESAPNAINGSVFLGCTGGYYNDVQSKATYLAFDATGHLVAADGKVPVKPKGEGNSRADFKLGNGYETPATANMPAVATLAGASSANILGKARTEPRKPGAW
ncbi:MAG: chitobiase/beta-hexosaminidase C-terminal domain-containing protein [Spirochaetota bacterium]